MGGLAFRRSLIACLAVAGVLDSLYMLATTEASSARSCGRSSARAATGWAGRVIAVHFCVPNAAVGAEDYAAINASVWTLAIGDARLALRAPRACSA